MKEKELIPAPIDNKNVMEDWIEDIFDNQTCIWGDRKCIGFINGQTMIASWTLNRLMWKFAELKNIEGSECLNVLRRRLNEAHDPDGNLIEEFFVVGNRLWQDFYWKNED